MGIWISRSHAPELAVQELQVEAGVVADDHGIPQARLDLAGDLGEDGRLGQLRIAQPVDAGGGRRERALWVDQLLVGALDAPPLGQDQAHLADAVAEPGRQAGGFQVEEGKAAVGQIEHGGVSKPWWGRMALEVRSELYTQICRLPVIVPSVPVNRLR